MRKKMYSTPVVVLAITGACLTLIGNGITIGSLVKKGTTAVIDEFAGNRVFDSGEYGFGEDIGGDDDFGYNDGDGNDHNSAEDMEGVDPATEALSEIPTYTAEGTTVSVTSERYRITKSTGNNSAVYLDVKYPVISGTDDAYTDEINKILKDQAMVSADEYYLNVEKRSKQQPGTDGIIYVVSEVTYQVTYLSDDFISVVFEDNYCPGDYTTQYIDMRSCNIDLKTGNAYDLSQIVNADAKMAEDFQKRLDDKYQYNDVIYGMDTDDYESMISGAKEQDDSFMGFYRTEDGLELFVSFHYFTEEQSMVGWLTAPYSMDDLQEYRSNSDFWNITQ